MGNDIQPKVSVIIPCYNVEAYLEECLNSIINQTLKEIEIICINDGSKDSTPQILEKYAQNDKRIVVINQENSGLSKTRNNGVGIAKGNFITFIDSDDWVDLDYLEKLYNAAINNSCDIACATVIRKRPNAQKYRFHYTEEKVYKTLEEKINICRIPECCYACGKLFKTDFIKNKPFKIGVYFEDVLWIPEVLKQSNAIVTIPESAYWYRVNQNSITKKVTPLKQFDSYKAKKYIVEFFKENNLTLPKKNQHPTKEVIYLFNIPMIRVKDFGEVDKYLLFDILPIKTRKNYKTLKYKNNKKMFFFKNTDAHFYIELFKQIKISFKNGVKFNYKEAKERGLVTEKRNPQLIVSLTSFPARIPMIDKTINTLLNQTIKPDKLILWLAEEQFPNKENDLTKELLALKDLGLEIKWCEDLRSYKKLVPALKEFPNDIIVTADDDLYYQEDWLESLYNEYLKNPNYIYTRRACGIRLQNNVLSVEPHYANSDYEPTFLNQLMGGAGTLYPPQSLHEDVFNIEQIKSLIPTHDDIYFWIMAVLKGTKIKLVKNKDVSFYAVKGTQDSGLCKANSGTQSAGMSPAVAFEKVLVRYSRVYDILERDSIKRKF